MTYVALALMIATAAVVPNFIYQTTNWVTLHPGVGY